MLKSNQILGYCYSLPSQILAVPFVDFATNLAGAGDAILFWSEQRLGKQPTDEELSKVTAQQVSNYYTALRRGLAVNNLSAPTDQSVLIRAAVLTLVDEFNVVGTAHNALLQWLATQSTLTNRAALQQYSLAAAITPAQALDAVRAKVSSGVSD